MMTIEDALIEVDYAAAQSPSPSTKTGCVVIYGNDTKDFISACNNFPYFSKHDMSRLQTRASRAIWLEHAERNAIAQAAAYGIDISNSTFVLRWFPCLECARMMCAVGVGRLVCTSPDWDDPTYKFKEARTMLEESGVEIDFRD